VLATHATLTVTAAQERGYLAHRHGLHPADEPATIENLASAHAGLHAARLPTPFVTLRARLPEFTAKELRQALEPGGHLIKLRTCRRTLHIYPLDEAPAAHAATVRQRLGACAATVRRLGKDPKILTRITPLIRQALTDGPLPHRELETLVLAAGLRVRAQRVVLGELVRLAIKWLWESGDLVYHNAADSLHRERREFSLTAQAHPGLQLNHLTASAAATVLLRRYLAAFGPASIEDFQWWSGLTRNEITPALAALRPDLINVRIDEHPASLLLLAEHEPHLLAAASLPSDHVDLLAYEDPALKGYFATRRRYVDDEHRATLFNSIGEVRASIAVAGRCVGTWQFDRATRTINHILHAPVPAAAQPAIAGRLDDMTEFLRSEPC
jgi:hypothetical protein